ncbi:MAG: hypothetical protein DWP95_11870 [Proteobacteria bacterium]|nr:MAG: hypothetical protein DWP95_11870 [Pseudomonadota bacterium]
MILNRLIITTLLLLIAFNGQSTIVRFETNIGNIDIELYDEQVPITVQNFLNYVNNGDYDGTVIHRSVPGFIIQGGGYRYSGSSVFQTVATDPAIINEAEISNTMGTIAMARTNAPNSATNQWFINLTDNSGVLDPSNSSAGYAVFGKVTRGFEVVKLIESFLRVNFSSSNLGQITNEFPIYGFFSGSAVTLDNTVEINRAYVLSDKFQINAGLSGAWFNPETNGQGIYLEVLPSVNMLISAWFSYDLLPPETRHKNGIGASEHRWFTMEGQYNEDTVESILILTEGGLFDSGEPVNYSLYGSVSIKFSSCNRAVMSYEIIEPAISGSIPLQRQSDANLALCQQLAAQANQGVTP